MVIVPCGSVPNLGLRCIEVPLCACRFTKVNRKVAEAVRIELTCPEGAVGFQPAGLPIAQRLRMEEGHGIEPSSRRSAGTQDQWGAIPPDLPKTGGR